MRSRPLRILGRALWHAGNTPMRQEASLRGIWFDVGAHHGETTLGYANHNPGLTIYAFEPNLRAAANLIGRAVNYIVVPMAVAEKDGSADLRITEYDQASSLLPMKDSARETWVGGQSLKIISTVNVPTIRLDTFMNTRHVDHVDYLKVDTQGADLSVVKSAGSRLADIHKITLEACITPDRLYLGAPSKEEIVAFLNSAGFCLVHTEKQSDGQEENLTFIRTGQVPPRPSFLKRFSNFLQYSRSEKALAIAVRWKKWLPHMPYPFRLSFGSWWLIQNSRMDELLLWEGGYWQEKAQVSFFRRFLKPGMTLLDVGAHHGLYTLMGSRLVGQQGRVIAFEPSPRERKRLRQHVWLNFCTNTKVESYALGSEAGQADLFVAEDQSEDWCNSLRPPAVQGATTTVTVDVLPLDDYLKKAGLRSLDLVKLDAEGAELSILKGARNTLQSANRPVLMTEVEDRRTQPWGYQAREIVTMLDDWEYEWFQPLPDGNLVEIGPARDRFETNLVAVPKERRQQVSEFQKG